MNPFFHHFEVPAVKDLFKNTNWFNVVAVFLVAVLVLLIAAMAAINYQSRAKIHDITLEQLKHDLGKLADTTGYFYAERKNDLFDLSVSPSISNYFVNRALGMSREYGLLGSLHEIQEAFRQLMARQTLGDEPFYKRIVFVASSGKLLADSKADFPPETDATDWSSYLPPRDGGVTMRVVAKQREDLLFSVPCFFKGSFAGMILAWGSSQVICKNLIDIPTRTSRRAVFLIYRDQNICKTRFRQKALNVASLNTLIQKQFEGVQTIFDRQAGSLFAVRMAVPGTAFTLLLAVPRSEVLGPLPVWASPVSIGLLCVFIMLGLNWMINTNVRNKLLRTRLDEAARRRRELEDSNRQLETAQKRLSEREQRYRTLTGNLPGIVYRINIKEGNRVQFFNDMLMPLTGFDQKDLGKSTLCALEDVIVAKDKQKVVDEIKAAIAENRAFSVTYEIKDKKSAARYFSDRGRPVFDDEGALLYIDGVILDITRRKVAEKEKKKMETRLRQAYKMESIATLVGGIAHDFNNTLGIILGNAELALDDLPQKSPARFSIEEVRTATLRASGVIRQLLSFSRKTDQKRKPIDIGAIVRESLKFMKATTPPSIRFDLDIDESIYTVMADPTQIHQIMINLCTNAVHAVQQKGGRITIALTNIVLNRRTASEYVHLAAGPYVRLRICDNGYGIPEEFIDRIFDPYFTTKHSDKGTGMGLTMVHGIVKNHDGAITVESTEQKGTRFEIFLPAVDMAPEPVLENNRDLPTGNETILFIDDEEAIVKMGRRCLARLGYRVETETNPQAALNMVRTEPTRFNLVITDMTMPNLNGDQLIQAVLKIRPDMPIILCTGYSEIIDEQKAKKLGVRFYIEKPIRKEILAVAVRNSLDKNG